MSRINGTRGNSPLNETSVDTDGRLYTRTIASSESEAALAEGERFSAYTATMTIVNANRNAVLYIRNLENRDIVFTGVTVGTGTSTGGADNIIVVEQVGGIVSTDAIIVAANTSTLVNSNAGSANEFTGISFKGPTADFAVGSAGAASGVRGDFTMPMEFEVLSQIPKGGEIGVVITPPAANTSMDVSITATFHLLADV